MGRIRRVCKGSLAFLAVVMIPLVLIGCGKSDEQSSDENPPEDTRIEAPAIGSSLPVNGGPDDSVNDDIDELIQYIEEHGIFPRAAQIPPSIKEALQKSEEYQEGVELTGLAEMHKKNNDTEEADKNYRLAAECFLKAATQHLEADISFCIYRAAFILAKRMSRPDYETAYILLKYSLAINPNDKLAIFSTAVINEIRGQNSISPDQMQKLDERVNRNLVRGKLTPSP